MLKDALFDFHFKMSLTFLKTIKKNSFEIETIEVVIKKLLFF